jgi:AmmeMemoRadiSam system protein B
MATISEVRPSPIAGRWYEGNPQRLAQQVDQYIESAHLPNLNGEVVGLIAPHAGHIYSGPTAGYAFRCVRGLSFDLVVVVSPMHSYAQAGLLTTAHQAYQTPLGKIPVDRAALQSLANSLKEVHLLEVANDREHSLEIELPFLQRALVGEFKLLPVMVHALDPIVSFALGQALAQILAGKRALLVGSTDLSHFYPLQIANQLDTEMLRQIESFSPEGMFAAEQGGTGFACGLGAVTSVLWAARLLGADQVKILHHSTSADETGDPGSVVGYGAAAILKSAAPQP